MPKSTDTVVEVRGYVVDVHPRLEGTETLLISVGGQRRKVLLPFRPRLYEILGARVEVKGIHQKKPYGLLPSYIAPTNVHVFREPTEPFSLRALGLTRVVPEKYRLESDFRRYLCRGDFWRDLDFPQAFLLWGIYFRLPQLPPRGWEAALRWYWNLVYEEKGEVWVSLPEAISYVRAEFGVPVPPTTLVHHFPFVIQDDRYVPKWYLRLRNLLRQRLEALEPLRTPPPSDPPSLARFLMSISGVFVISGSSGTGKTTLARKVASYLNKELYYVLLLGSTGRAAAKIGGFTFARKQGLQYNGSFRFKKFPPVENVVFLDEAGKLDLRSLYHAIRSTGFSQTLVLLGDPDQPGPAVGEHIFREVVEILRAKGRVLELRTRHRFDPSKRQNVVFRCRNWADATLAVATAVLSAEARGESWLVATGYHEGKLGTRALGVRLRAALQGMYPLSRQLEGVSPDRFYSGDPLLAVSNVLIGEGYYFIPNGTKVEYLGPAGKEEIRVRYAGHEWIAASSGFRLGYVDTYHSVQGQEADIAVVVVPKDESLKDHTFLEMLHCRARKKSIFIVIDVFCPKTVADLRKLGYRDVSPRFEDLRSRFRKWMELRRRRSSAGATATTMA